MINKQQKNKQQKSGFSLIEVLVSVFLFVVIILSSTEIFRLVIESQREAIASQNVQESLKYFYEVIGKEIRMARRNDGKCPQVPVLKMFMVTNNGVNNALHFQNYHRQCVTYELALDGESQRFKITRDLNSDFISPKKIFIEKLRFVLDEIGQASVTIYLEAHALGSTRFKTEMHVQTTITSRYYK